MSRNSCLLIVTQMERLRNPASLPTERCLPSPFSSCEGIERREAPRSLASKRKMGKGAKHAVTLYGLAGTRFRSRSIRATLVGVSIAPNQRTYWRTHVPKLVRTVAPSVTDSTNTSPLADISASIPRPGTSMLRNAPETEILASYESQPRASQRANVCRRVSIIFQTGAGINLHPAPGSQTYFSLIWHRYSSAPTLVG